MKQLLLVALGGCLGAMTRYKLGGLILHHTADWRFPLGTFVVNVLGCFVAGLIAGCIERLDWFAPEARTFLLAGLLGGFTTFSAFSLESVFLLRRGEFAVAAAYVALSVVCGLAALWVGMSIVPHR